MTQTLSDIRQKLEWHIIDWNQSAISNNGLMLSIEDIYPETTIVSNRADSQTEMLAMTDEIARIAYAISSLYASTLTVQADIDDKLQELCDARDTHEANRAAWITYRNSLDPTDPDYTDDFNDATTNANNSETRKDARQADYDDLYGDANPILVAIEEQYNNLLGGVLKAIYNCNKAVGTEIDESYTDSSAFAYIIRTSLKIQKWIQFSSQLNTTTKLKSVNFIKQLKDGSGNHEEVVDLLSAFEMTSTEILSEVSFKDAIIEGYGPEMISNMASANSVIGSEYAFLQALLVTETSGDKTTFNDTTAEFTTTTATNGFKTSTWHQDQITALDPLPDPYEAEPSGQEFIPAP